MVTYVVSQRGGDDLEERSRKPSAHLDQCSLTRIMVLYGLTPTNETQALPWTCSCLPSPATTVAAPRLTIILVPPSAWSSDHLAYARCEVGSGKRRQ